MKTGHDIIIRPIDTERSTSGISDRKYTFEVAADATKIDIRNAVEEAFGVKVESVNVMNVRGVKKRLSMGRPEGYTPSWKKAIVRLKKDSKTIEFFDSLM